MDRKRAKSDYMGGEPADEKVLFRMILSNARMAEDLHRDARFSANSVVGAPATRDQQVQSGYW